MTNNNQDSTRISVFFRISFTLRLILTIVSLAIYWVLTVVLDEYIGNESYTFLILPAVVSSAFFGMRAGYPVVFLAPVVSVIINYFHFGWTDFSHVELLPIIISIVISLIASITIGFLRNLQYRLEAETGERIRIESDKNKQTKSLKELESRIRTIFENATIGFYRIAPEGSIVMVNPALLKMMKYPFFEIVFQQDMSSQYFPHYSIPDFKERINKEGRIISLESQWERYDGSKIFIYETAWQVFDENGRLAYIDGIISDITEKKQTEIALKDNMQRLEKEIAERIKAEQTLKESEEKYKDIVEKAGISITINDAEGNITFYNNQFSQIFGFDSNEISTIKIFDLVHPDDIEKVKKYHTDRIKGLFAPTRYEVKGINKNGITIYLEVDNVALKENNQIVGTRTYMWEITERKLTEMALMENEERLRGIFENATVGFYRTTPSGKIILANQTLLNILKYPSFEAISVINLEEGPETKPDRLLFKKQLEKEGRIFGRQDHWRRSDGTYATIRESAWLIRDKEGEPLYYEGIVEDISEMVQAEEEYHAIRSELDKSRYEIKLLYSLLPICTSCKKIREEDKWININQYIRSHKDIEYGEKLCPDCVEELSGKAAKTSTDSSSSTH
jgi:PAS domain S-box-containing protein